MSRCLIEVDFLFNEKDYIFAKQILVCGIAKNGKSLVKEITYNYPTKLRESDPDQDADSYISESRPSNAFKNGLKNGNLEFPRTDVDLSKILARFSTVIVKNRMEKEFIANYTDNDVIILEEPKKRQ